MPEEAGGTATAATNDAAALPARRAALQQPANTFPVPWTPVRPDSLRPELPRPTSRWSWLVQAGPALTYRRYRAGYDSVAGAEYGPSAARYEQVGVGLAGQAQARVAVTSRLRLAFGIGYSEYRTRIRLNVQHATRQISSSLDTIRSGVSNSWTGQVRYRDTLLTTSAAYRHTERYRFLTLPLQLEYAFATGHPRLGYAVLLGAVPAWYLGGETTRGEACSCEARTWGSSGSPYRPASLSLSLGAAVHYRLTERWAVRLQPTATYGLTSLSRSPAERWLPWSAGLQVGLLVGQP